MEEQHTQVTEETNVQHFEPSEPQEETLSEEEFALEAEDFEPALDDQLLWQARTGLNEETLCGAIETIIFMSDRPISLAKIKAHVDAEMPLRIVHEAIQKLQAEYETKRHGIRLLEVAEGYQFRTKPLYSKYVQDLFKLNSLVLTPSALEVLAIIAYRQPVSRVDVDRIRGVDSSHLVKALQDRRLVKIIGRSEDVGRPVIYGTTTEFLEVFNLRDLNDLPTEHEITEDLVKSVGKISDIKEVVKKANEDKFKFDDFEELDELANCLKNIVSSTEFTKELTKEKTEGAEKKTAFEVLEEFVAVNEIVEANKKSGDSSLVMEFVDPKIVTDLLAGPHNAPEDDDGFEMVDLNTGKTVEVGNEEDELKEEREKLVASLDELFKETQNKIEETEELQMSEDEEELLDLAEEEIEALKAQALEEAKELDIDLSFLQDTEIIDIKEEMDEDQSEY